LSSGKFGFCPAAFRAYGQSRLRLPRAGRKNLVQGQCVGPLGSMISRLHQGNHRRLARVGLRPAELERVPARLLRGFDTRFCSSDRRVLLLRLTRPSRCVPRLANDGAYAEFGGFLDGPLEGVEFLRRREAALHRGSIDVRDVFEENEIDAIASDHFDAAERTCWPSLSS